VISLQKLNSLFASTRNDGVLKLLIDDSLFWIVLAEIAVVREAQIL
jgi:hypothetical protein